MGKRWQVGEGRGEGFEGVVGKVKVFKGEEKGRGGFVIEGRREKVEGKDGKVIGS